MNGLKHYPSALARFATVLLAILFLAAPMLAVAADEPADESRVELLLTKFQCDQTVPGITNRAIECVDTLLSDLSSSAFAVIIEKLTKAVTAAMIIFVAISGMKVVLGGMRNPKAEILIMLLKISFVALFALQASNLNSIYEIVRAMSSGLTHMVSTSVSASGACSEGSVWNRVDCTILGFVGKIQVNKDDKGKITSLGVEETKGPVDLDCNGVIEGKEAEQPIPDIQLFQVALSQFFSPHGVFILVMIIASALMLFASFTYALLVYIIALVAITFLMMLAPIFMPLFLFNQTKKMFLTWCIQIVSYMIQPCLMVAFLTFLLATVNIAIHGDGTPGSVGLSDILAQINTKMEQNQCTRKPIMQSGSAVMADMNNRLLSDEEAAARRPGEQMDAVTVPYTPLPYDLLSLFIVHLLSTIVLLYIMYGMLKNVADFAGSLSGGAAGNLGRYMPGMGKAGGMATDALRNALKK